jgi:hypothetical protein
MITEISLDIAITPPPGSYIQVMPRSSLARKGITTFAGVIDPDYRGSSIILLYNTGQKCLPIAIGDRVTHIIFTAYSSPDLHAAPELQQTDRNDKGFGSTGTNDKADIRAATTHIPEMPYNIYLSDDLFDVHVQIHIQDFGQHETMGMILQDCKHRTRPQLLDILPSQPLSYIKNWRKTLKNGYLMQAEEYIIFNINEAKQAIAHCRRKTMEAIQLEFAFDINPAVYIQQKESP